MTQVIDNINGKINHLLQYDDTEDVQDFILYETVQEYEDKNSGEKELIIYLSKNLDIITSISSITFFTTMGRPIKIPATVWLASNRMDCVPIEYNCEYNIPIGLAYLCQLTLCVKEHIPGIAYAQIVLKGKRFGRNFVSLIGDKEFWFANRRLLCKGGVICKPGFDSSKPTYEELQKSQKPEYNFDL